MHILGLRDVVLERVEFERGFDIFELTLSMVRGDKAIGDGHILAGANGRRFSCCTADGDPMTLSLPMRNPFGRLRLTKLQHAASKKQEPALVIH